MADPHWTGYVGMVTGIVGSITGVTGAIMGYVSYRKSSKIKALDLRIELRKEWDQTRTAYDNLISLMDRADGSRKAILAALGVFRSSTMDRWSTSFENDKKSIKQIPDSIPDIDTNYDNLSERELESELINVHRVQLSLNGLIDKYKDAIAWDDEQRKQYREDQRTKDKLRIKT